MSEDQQTSRFKSYIGFLLVGAGLIILVWVAFTEYNDYSAAKESAEPISQQSPDGKPAGPGVLPKFIVEASSNTRKAYLFASKEKNQTSMEAAECYCPCAHDSLLGCFISERKSNSKVVYATHGASCGVCVDETLSVKKWVSEGKSAEEISELVDKEYGGR
ncbi:MAG TPA: hypothetical protein ENI11_01500 [Actinobacteria bacterium]|nr:hypothetical protein [Actinomycetota bacterium]